MCSRIEICVYAVILITTFSASMEMNTTDYQTTTEDPSDSVTTDFYTTIPHACYYDDSPSSSPTLPPTLIDTKSFPYGVVTSYINCGRRIQMEDTASCNAFVKLDVAYWNRFNKTNGRIFFGVCKDTTFRSQDILSFYKESVESDSQTATEDQTIYSPSVLGDDCVSFKMETKNILTSDTYYITLNRYRLNDYGPFTIYMQCDRGIVENDFNRFVTSGLFYNEYSQDDSSFASIYARNGIISGISCGIIVSNNQVSQAEFNAAADKKEYYSFTVTKIMSEIELSTRDDTSQAHTLTLYYTSYDGSEWQTKERSANGGSQSATLTKSYLIPGIYYVSIDISSLVQNRYTISMACTDEDAIQVVTEYEEYDPKATPSPTPSPSTPINTQNIGAGAGTEGNENSSSSSSIILPIALILVLILLGLGIYFGHKKYKERNKPSNKSKGNDNVAKAMKLEMVSSAGDDVESPSYRNTNKRNVKKNVRRQPHRSNRRRRRDDDESEETESSSSQEDVSKLSKSKSSIPQAHAPSEGDILAAVPAAIQYSEGGLVSPGDADIAIAESAPFIPAMAESDAAAAHNPNSVNNVDYMSDNQAMENNVDETAPAVAFGNFSGNFEIPVMAESAHGDIPVYDPNLVQFEMLADAEEAAPGGENEQHEISISDIKEDEYEEEDFEEEEEEEEESSSPEVIVKKEPKKKKKLEIKKGSYVYVDCDTVYGVVTDVLQYDYYMIIDFFEKRKRKAHKNALNVISDETIIQKAKKQHKKYERKRKKSSGKKGKG